MVALGRVENGVLVREFRPDDELFREAVLMQDSKLLEMGLVLAETMPDEAWGWYKVGLREYMLRNPEYSLLLEKYLEHSESVKPEFPRPMAERLALAAGMGILRDVVYLIREWTDKETQAGLVRAAKAYLKKKPDTEMARVVRYLINLSEGYEARKVQKHL